MLLPLNGVHRAQGAEVQTVYFAAHAETAVANPVLSFQGRLVNPTNGLPLSDGAYQIAFRLYNVESAGAPLWQEAHTVAVNRSVFSVLLGSLTALNLADFNGQPLWLGITVGADPEMTPRQRLAHAPYAILAERVKDGAATSATIADDSIAAADLAPNSVGTSEIAANAVDSARIVEGSIAAGDIGAEQVDDARIRNTLRAITVPANALNFDKASAVITQHHLGLHWLPNFQNAATISLAKPLDWDGTSNVELKLFFYFEDAGAGVAQFFVRPRSFNGGDSYVDAGSNNGNTVAFTGVGRFGEQTFTIPAASMLKNWWYITIQRQGQSETYAGDLILSSVRLTYTAVR